ncbi:MAG: hypothetical protein ACR2JS_07445 [Candidatus Nanopelagicales bacterium]
MAITPRMMIDFSGDFLLPVRRGRRVTFSFLLLLLLLLLLFLLAVLLLPALVLLDGFFLAGFFSATGGSQEFKYF